jgi:phospholipase C
MRPLVLDNRLRSDVTGSRRATRRAAAGIVLAVLVSLAFAAAPGSRGAAAVPGIGKIQHIIMIMQENRSFDEYFGTFPGANGIPMVNGVPTVCIPDPVAGNCVRPFPDHDDNTSETPHHHVDAIADINGGKMDGFIDRAEKRVAACLVCAIGPNAPRDTVGYLTESDIPNYWAYARNFGLQDRMFEPVDSWSLPAGLYKVSGWSATCTAHNPSSCVSDVTPKGYVGPGSNDPTHVQVTADSPIYAWTDITHLLHRNNISWRYYVVSGKEPDCRDPSELSCVPVAQGPKSLSFWNPLPYFDTVRANGQVGNVQSVTNFYDAARSGALPAVSWIVPSWDNSEHPPASVRAGQSFVTSLVNAVMNSPQWNSTAIFVAWDDWGGRYDHVVPPTVDENGYGLRVPGLVISPYAKRGFIDHTTLSFDSYLRFVEDRFLGGQRLDPATDGRPDPRPTVRENRAGDLSSAFDFNQAPRPPMLLPVFPASTLRAVQPFTPEAVSAVSGDARATVAWRKPLSDGGSPITGYVVTPYRDGVAQAPQRFNSTATSQTLTGLTNARSYEFAVAGINARGTGPPSKHSPKIIVGSPRPPSPATATAGNGQATVGWTTPYNGGSSITSYTVTAQLGTNVQTHTYSATARSAVVTGLTNGGAYFFSVMANNARGASRPAVVIGVVGVPSAPRAPSATPGDGSATVRWTEPVTDNGAGITGYVVTGAADGLTRLRRTFNSPSIMQTITGLVNGSTYTFTVAAMNTRGTGPQSNATSPIAIGTPTMSRGVSAASPTRNVSVHRT